MYLYRVSYWSNVCSCRCLCSTSLCVESKERELLSSMLLSSLRPGWSQHHMRCFCGVHMHMTCTSCPVAGHCGQKRRSLLLSGKMSATNTKFGEICEQKSLVPYYTDFVHKTVAEVMQRRNGFTQRAQIILYTNTDLIC